MYNCFLRLSVYIHILSTQTIIRLVISFRMTMNDNGMYSTTMSTYRITMNYFLEASVLKFVKENEYSDDHIDSVSIHEAFYLTHWYHLIYSTIRQDSARLQKVKH